MYTGILKIMEIEKAYRCGVVAKQSGHMRVSPFYENEQADALFFDGYDNGNLKPVAENQAVETKISLSQGEDV